MQDDKQFYSKQDAWISGFITAAYLFSGNRQKYEERRDEYLEAFKRKDHGNEKN